MAEAGFRCPTCLAKQEPQDECRRCKSDLRLYREAYAAAAHWKAVALQHIWRHDYRAAVHAARKYRELAAGEDAERLIVVAHLLAQQYDTVLAALREP